MAPADTVYILLAIFVPGAFIATVLGLAGIYFSSKKEIRSRELSADLVTQMLNRKMSVEEIEHVLLAWSQDADFAKSMAKAKRLQNDPKPAPFFA